MRKYFKISLIYIISIAILLIITSLSLYYFSSKFLEPKGYDFLSKINSNRQASKDIVNVVIDESSLYEIGRWPWKRTYYNDIFEYLQKYGGAKLIVFDSIIVSPENTQSDREFVRRIGNTERLITGISFIKEKKFSKFNGQEDLLRQKFSIKVKDKRNILFVENSKYTNFIDLLPGYLEIVKHIGSVSVQVDQDGIIRRIEPLINYNNDYYPSLALSALLNLDPPKSIEMDEYYIYLNYDNKKTKKLPINSESTINSYIRWYKPLTNKNLSAHQQYSAWKIIRSYENIKQNKMPLINPDEFKGKIVVVGATATVLHDIKTTSIGSNYPGVDIQTTYIDNILNDYTMAQAPVILNIIGLILAVGLTLFLIIRLIPIYSFISTLILMFLYLYLAMYYHSQGFAIDLVTPYLFMVLTLIIGYAYRYSREDRTKTKIKTAMEKYVSKNIVTKVIKDTDEIELGGEKAEITVLFADIRGFTGISEDLPPEIVTDLLNEYFRVMLPVIEKYNGVLNKFMGDAILAIFGDPIKDDKHPENAIRCADEMIKEVFKIRERWKKEGKPKIDIGIGINTGIAFIGNVGTQERLEYTVIGDTVNVANRIEAQNKIYNTKLLISETTYQRVKDFVDTIKISSVEIRGREKLINIYEIIKLLDDE